MSDWRQLDDLEVEVVARDLLAAEWGVHVESFRRGPDGGIDLRAVGPIPGVLNRPGIVLGQVKHYPEANTSRVLAAFRAESRRDVVHAADAYVCVTTASLSIDAKIRIAALFDLPGFEPERHVLGREDLEALLVRHQHIRRFHHRLWLGEIDSISQVLHAPERLRQRQLQDKLARASRELVATSVVDTAREVLQRCGAVVMSGPPGAGKTSTALVLLLEHYAEGWEIIPVRDELTEAERLLEPGRKQVLFYDDFLGPSLIVSIQVVVTAGGVQGLPVMA